MFWFGSFNGNSCAANRARNEKRSRLDPVRNDVVLGAVQFLHALDDDPSCARAFNLSAHFVQKVCEIDNFRFRAAPSITVVPSDRTAAIITLSVPSTVGPNLPHRFTTAPVNFGANTLMSPPSTRTADP